MGSQTPDGDRRDPDESARATIINVNPPKPAAASGLLQGSLEGQDQDADDEDTTMSSVGQPGNKKNKKTNKKKKKKPAGIKQSDPPRVAIENIFHGRSFPQGEVMEYVVKNDNLQRTTAEETRHLAVLDDMDDGFLNDYRKAAEVHRQVRHHVKGIAKPGVSMEYLVQEIEDGVRALVGEHGSMPGDALRAGLAFPTGLCLNNVAAHWTHNPGAKEVILKPDDVLKIDFGVHVNGRIVDSAFTVADNPVYDPLLTAVKAATNTGLKEAGIDVRMDHLSAEMQEVMESYEVNINGRTIPVKAMRSLTGHNILRYKIHGDKQVPFVKTRTSQHMEEGDIFAIETFGTTGSGRTKDDIGVYGYDRKDNVSTAGLHQSSAKSLLKTIDAHFGTLVFSKRYLAHAGIKNYHVGMKALIANDIVESYGPLVDVPGSHVAQFEHTVLLRPNCKEIISRGDDY